METNNNIYLIIPRYCLTLMLQKSWSCIKALLGQYFMSYSIRYSVSIVLQPSFAVLEHVETDSYIRNSRIMMALMLQIGVSESLMEVGIRPPRACGNLYFGILFVHFGLLSRYLGC